MPKPISEGRCLFCGDTFKKAGITRHLNTHLAGKAITGRPGKSVHLKVEVDPRWGATPLFLNLWVDGDSKLKDIDSFLRKIWLECCGHMSAFMPAAGRGEIGMGRKAADVFQPDTKLGYEYDFGSTTALQLSVAGVFPVAADEKIVLLSRNEPLAIMCETCGQKLATQACSVCGEAGEKAAFCDACAEKHAESCEDFADYAAMTIVNSPRMGVCGYEGGTIDIERDHAHSK